MAEGSVRATNNDQAHFSNIAFSSSLETIDHLIYAFDMEYISEQTYTEFRLKLDEIMNKVNSLYKYQIGQIESLKDKLRKWFDIIGSWLLDILSDKKYWKY